jgi:hypothetical protein
VDGGALLLQWPAMFRLTSREAKVGGAKPPYTAIASFKDSTSSSLSAQTFSHRVAPVASAAQARLVFNGTLYAMESVCFDNVTLVKN